jgi:hypothetical protein
MRPAPAMISAATNGSVMASPDQESHCWPGDRPANPRRTSESGWPRSWVTEGCLSTTSGKNLLFSPSQQIILTLNDTATSIWRGLEKGAGMHAIAAGLCAMGIDFPTAQSYVESALEEWERLGFLRPPAPDEGGAGISGTVSQHYEVGSLRFRLSGTAEAMEALAPVFAPFACLPCRPDISIALLDRGARLHVYLDSQWERSCRPEELPTVVKGQVLTHVLNQGGYEVALHAACLVKDNQSMLLVGSPGAGKTTLCMALLRDGFQFAGDDVTLLMSGGLAMGIPFAPAVKAGAWPLLGRLHPDLRAAPILRRADKRRVRYPLISPTASIEPRTVRRVFVLRRRPGSRAELQLCEPVETMGFLMKDAFAVGRRLTPSAFLGLSSLAGSSTTHVLHYSELEEATRCLVDVWR